MNKDNFFDASQLDQIGSEYVKVHEKYKGLLLRYLNLNLKDETATEYCRHGFLRRLRILKRCIENIYTICPPEKLGKFLKDDDLLDITIYLHSFMFNVFGCLDNLAWIWVSENQLKDKNDCPLKKTKVGFMSEKDNNIVRKSFSKNFQNYLNGGLATWYDKYLIEYRHALAHRIPLYIPPTCLNSQEVNKYENLEKQKSEATKQDNLQLLRQINGEQDRLGKFVPLMKHSYGENSRPVVFHAQILADWNTIVEVAEKFLNEFSFKKENSKVDSTDCC